MRDFIITMCLTAALIAVFSMFGYKPQEVEQKNGNFVLAVESGQESTPQPTEGTEPFVPVPEPTEATEPPTEPIVTMPTKTIDELAWEVIIGYWGYMEDRWQRLSDAGYDAMAVQQRVNEILERSDFDGS